VHLDQKSIVAPNLNRGVALIREFRSERAETHVAWLIQMPKYVK
jgi:hypothetical protein